MKFEIMLSIVFMLLKGKQVNATEIAERFGISRRTVYRYIDELSISVPIMTVRGVQGGFVIADSFRLPATFLTEGEYSVVMQALQSLKEEFPGEQLSSAMDKLAANSRADSRLSVTAGNIIIDSGPWGVTADYGNKIKVLGECVEKCRLALITYRDADGRLTERTVEPHVLVLKQGIWYMYAFCHMRGDFRLFKVGRIENIFIKSGEFARRDVSHLKEALTYSARGEGSISVEMSVDQTAAQEIEEWLGVDCVERKDGRITARAVLPDNSGLVYKILSYGGRVEVTRPEALRQRVLLAAKQTVEKYS